MFLFIILAPKLCFFLYFQKPLSFKISTVKQRTSCQIALLKLPEVRTTPKHFQHVQDLLNYIKQRLDVTNRMSTNDLRSLCVDKVMIFEPETLVDIPRTTQDSVSPDSPLAVFSLCCVLALNLLHQNQAGLHCRETWCVRSALLRRPRHTFSRGWQLGGCRTSLLRWNPNTVSRSWCLAVRTFK